MSLSPQRMTMITLGVADLARSRNFYETLGWREHQPALEGVAFYQLSGFALALYGREDLARDQDRAGESLGTGAVTLAQNFNTEAEVDAAFAAALAAGGRALTRPKKVFWGGYSCYWADPDGHVWELSTNPFSPLHEDGTLTL